MHKIESKNYNIGYTRTKSIKNKSSMTKTFFRKIPVKKGDEKSNTDTVEVKSKIQGSTGGN